MDKKQKIIKIITLLAMLLVLFTISISLIIGVFRQGDYNIKYGVDLKSSEEFLVEMHKIVSFVKTDKITRYKYNIKLKSGNQSIADIQEVIVNIRKSKENKESKANLVLNEKSKELMLLGEVTFDNIDEKSEKVLTEEKENKEEKEIVLKDLHIKYTVGDGYNKENNNLFSKIFNVKNNLKSKVIILKWGEYDKDREC